MATQSTLAPSALTPISTPTPQRNCCTFCTAYSSHKRRDATGVTHYACAEHQIDLEAFVRDLNEWDGERHASA